MASVAELRANADHKRLDVRLTYKVVSWDGDNIASYADHPIWGRREADTAGAELDVGGLTFTAQRQYLIRRFSGAKAHDRVVDGAATFLVRDVEAIGRRWMLITVEAVA